MLFDYLKSNRCLDMSHSSFNCSSASQSYSVCLNGNTKPSIIHYRTNSSIFRMLTLDRSVNTCHPLQTVLGWPTNVDYEQNAKATAFVRIFVKCVHTQTRTNACLWIYTLVRAKLHSRRSPRSSCAAARSIFTTCSKNLLETALFSCFLFECLEGNAW